MIKGNALVLTHGFLDTVNAKTCHGLLRYTSRFDVKGVIDEKFGGRDAGEVMDGVTKNIPVFSSVNDYFEKGHESIDYLVIGVATHGGLMPEQFKKEILNAIDKGCSIVNGLHDYLAKMQPIVDAAAAKHVNLIDIRKPKDIKDLHFWEGEIFDVKAPIIAVLGVDCALGKRTTTGFLYEMFNKKNIKTEMIYTGQTGWMQGYKHGFIFDSTLNDFISGEIEKAIVDCWEDTHPELILLEGQSSLRNPSGPAGSEFLLSGNAKGVILQLAPERIYFDGYEKFKILLPTARDEINMINQYGSEVIAVTVNNQNLNDTELRNLMILMEQELEIPVVAPLVDGVDELYQPVLDYMARYKEEM
jgi:uncharacterized NAD-dependent epimerase/dehydratase family protein